MKDLAPLFLITAVLCNQSYAQHLGYLPQQRGVLSWLEEHAEGIFSTASEPADGKQTQVTLMEPDLLTQSLIGGDPMMNMASIQSIIDEVHHLKQNSPHDSRSISASQQMAKTVQTPDVTPPQTLAANDNH